MHDPKHKIGISSLLLHSIAGTPSASSDILQQYFCIPFEVSTHSVSRQRLQEVVLDQIAVSGSMHSTSKTDFAFIACTSFLPASAKQCLETKQKKHVNQHS